MIFQLDLSDGLNPQLSIKDNVEGCHCRNTSTTPIVAVVTPIDPTVPAKIAAETSKTFLDAWFRHNNQLKNRLHRTHLE